MIICLQNFNIAGQSIEMNLLERKDDYQRDQCYPNFQALLLMILSRVFSEAKPIPPLKLSACKAIWHHLLKFETDLAYTFMIVKSKQVGFPTLGDISNWLMDVDMGDFRISEVSCPSRILWQEPSQWVQHVPEFP